MNLHSRIGEVTERIRKRSHDGRARYLEMIEHSRQPQPFRTHLSCSNLAHGTAACGDIDKNRLIGEQGPNLGIITAYNDMLSAHQPFHNFPEKIRAAARAAGGTAQVAGGVPAMCDGITQGQAGMELSLFSRDVIAQGTAIALSHDVFDGALYLGICDKIVPGMLIGALTFGHLPGIFVPSGPMPSGLPNKAKAEVRERYAAGKASREELMRAEAGAYHAPGTCTFYGTANSNQMLLEAMGLVLPGAAFVNPGTPLREALTRSATERALAITALGQDYRPLGQLINERSLVNAISVLMATAGSTNHTIHWIAVARAAGITLTWDDYHDIAEVVPLLVRLYPNGQADINQFNAAGGTAFLLRELLSNGLIHGDVETVVTGGLEAYTHEPRVYDDRLSYAEGTPSSADEDILRPVDRAFDPHGGLRLLTGNLGRALIKVSALPEDRHCIEAPAVVVDDQQELARLHAAKRLPHDFVAVVRFQGPRANGMPELHSLTPLLGYLQDQGSRVALVTDGRLSGASGKVPSAIHLTPEAAAGGPLAKIRDGDVILLDTIHNRLELKVDAATLAARQVASNSHPSAIDIGRVLFAGNRARVGLPEEGALSISLYETAATAQPASKETP